MHAIVMKYFQLVCIAVLFENVNCEQLSLENSKDDYLLNRTIGCTAICMKDNPNQVSAIHSCAPCHLCSFFALCSFDHYPSLNEAVGWMAMFILILSGTSDETDPTRVKRLNDWTIERFRNYEKCQQINLQIHLIRYIRRNALGNKSILIVR